MKEDFLYCGSYIYIGDALEVLKELPSDYVQTVVTSPPYWGLRDYGTAEWKGGKATCDHRHQLGGEGQSSAKQNTSAGTQTIAYRTVCGKCGARRVDAQLGLEPTPDEYVANLVRVFREVRRVMRDDGTLWLNLGDSYAAMNASGPQGKTGERATRTFTATTIPKMASGLKPKDLCGIPWRVAFGLQADGWYLRSSIIWAKPNPMPESITDRPTKSHENIFLFSKSPDYFYDHEAVKELAVHAGRLVKASGAGAKNARHVSKNETKLVFTKHDTLVDATRNLRDVWTITTKPFKGAHFATFPPDLAERCIKAGSPQHGVCGCGAPWERIRERVSTGKSYSVGKSAKKNAVGLLTGFSGYDDGSSSPVFRTVGWKPSCKHKDADAMPSVVLDPFCGSGTAGVVALAHERHFIGIELNREYLPLIRRRFRNYEREVAEWLAQASV